MIDRIGRERVRTVRRAVDRAGQGSNRTAQMVRHWAMARPEAERLAARRGCRILHCLGDSHSPVFRSVSKNRAQLPRTWFDVTEVLGATALGLANPKSQTNAMEIFRRTIHRLPPSRYLLFLLGEVDCGYLVWYRSQHRGTTVESEFGQAMGNYLEFVERIWSEGRTNLILATIPLPTIEDYNVRWNGLPNIREGINSSIEERTELTRRWNAEIRSWAVSRACHVLDTEPDLLDVETGVIRPEFKASNPLDHHLETVLFASVVARRLGELGFS